MPIAWGSQSVDAAYLGECPLGLALGDCDLLEGGPPGPGQTIFHAHAPDESGVMQNVLVGTPGIVNARTAVSYALDYQGIYRPIDPAITGYLLSRVNKNLIDYSEDFANVAWVELGAATKTPVGNECIIDFHGVQDTSASLRTRITVGDLVFGVDGARIAYAVDIKSESGGNEANIAVQQNSTFEITRRVVTLNESYKRVVVSHTGAPGAATLISAFVESSANNTGPIRIRFPHLADLRTEPDPTIPMEYVSTGSSVGPASKSYATENGNSVDGNGVVTAGQGADLPEMPFAQYAPEMQNIVRASYAQNSGPWQRARATPSDNPESFAEGKISVDFLATTEEGAHYSRYWLGDVYNGLTGLCVVYAKKGNQRRIQITAAHATTDFDFDAGDFIPGTGNNVIAQAAIALANGWWKISVEHAANNANNKYIGTSFTDDDGNINWSPVGTETWAVGNCEYYSEASIDDVPPIFTEDEALTRDKDTGIPAQALSDTEGSFSCELDVPAGNNILGQTWLDFDGTRFRFSDDTNLSEVLATPGKHVVGGVWGPDGLALKVTDTWGALVAYDGTLPGGLELFYLVKAMGYIRNIQVADESSVAWVNVRVHGGAVPG